SAQYCTRVPVAPRLALPTTSRPVGSVNASKGLSGLGVPEESSKRPGTPRRKDILWNFEPRVTSSSKRVDQVMMTEATTPFSPHEAPSEEPPHLQLPGRVSYHF